MQELSGISPLICFPLSFDFPSLSCLFHSSFSSLPYVFLPYLVCFNLIIHPANTLFSFLSHFVLPNWVGSFSADQKVSCVYGILRHITVFKKSPVGPYPEPV